MLAKRLIPTLILDDDKLIHIKNFNKKTSRYIGDPLNTINIFNQYAVDELILLDIFSHKKKKINFKLLEILAQEAFFPLSYGGGVSSVDDAKKLISLGYEKIIINKNFFENPDLIADCVKTIGAQSIILSIDICYKNSDYFIFDHTKNQIIEKKIKDIINYIKKINIGELMICSVDVDGTMLGHNKNLIKLFDQEINIPLIYKGGTKSYDSIKEIFSLNVDALSSSTLFIMKKIDGGIVINYPSNSFKNQIC